MSRNTKKNFHNKLNSGKEKTHSQTKKIRNKYLGGLSVVPQKNIGNCAAHAITRSIYRLCKKHNMKIPGTNEVIPDPPNNSEYFYDFALIQLVLNKFSITVNNKHYDNNILYILEDLSRGLMKGGGNKTKDKIETIRKHIDDINETIHEISKKLEPINDGTVKNIEEVKKLSDEINRLRSEKNDHIQNLNDLIYQNKIKMLDVINTDDLKDFEEEELYDNDAEAEVNDKKEENNVDQKERKAQSQEETKTTENKTQVNEKQKDEKQVNKKQENKTNENKKQENKTKENKTKENKTKTIESQSQGENKTRRLPSSSELLSIILKKLNFRNANILNQINNATSDFEKAKILLENMYFSRNEKITIPPNIFNDYIEIDKKQRFVYFTILPMATYIYYMISNLPRDMNVFLNLEQTNTLATIINKINSSANAIRKEYYIDFNKDLNGDSPIKYPDIQDIKARVTKQYNDYARLLEQFNGKKIVCEFYDLDKYIEAQKPIYGFLSVSGKYMNKFPESKHADEHSHGHAVSITSINYKANKREGVIVKYKNSWIVMFGEKGHQTMELKHGDFSSGMFDANHKISIFGITLK